MAPSQPLHDSARAACSDSGELSMAFLKTLEAGLIAGSAAGVVQSAHAAAALQELLCNIVTGQAPGLSAEAGFRLRGELARCQRLAQNGLSWSGEDSFSCTYGCARTESSTMTESWEA